MFVSCSRRLAPLLFRGTRLLSATAMGNQGSTRGDDPVYRERQKPEITFTEEELRAKLTDEQYRVTQQKGTERAWTGKYVNVKEDGTFFCVVCGSELFKTDKKFESGSGWPSFSDVARKGAVHRIVDDSHGMIRTEVVCAKCGGHLGHVFDDGPQDSTGLRYCVNSASLKFNPAKEEAPPSEQEQATEEDK